MADLQKGDITVICKKCSSLCDWLVVRKSAVESQVSRKVIYQGEDSVGRERGKETSESFTWECPVCTFRNRVTLKRKFDYPEEI